MRLGFTVVFPGRMKGILEKFVDCSRSTLFLLFHIQALMSLCFPLNVGSIVFMPPYFRVVCALQLGCPLFSKNSNFLVSLSNTFVDFLDTLFMNCWHIVSVKEGHA